MRHGLKKNKIPISPRECNFLAMMVLAQASKKLWYSKLNG